MSTEPHDRIREYSCNALTSDVELWDVMGRPARNIYVVTAGAGKLEVEFADGDIEAITLLEDGQYVEPSPANFYRIKMSANTDCDLIRVGW